MQFNIGFSTGISLQQLIIEKKVAKELVWMENGHQQVVPNKACAV